MVRGPPPPQHLPPTQLPAVPSMSDSESEEMEIPVIQTRATDTLLVTPPPELPALPTGASMSTSTSSEDMFDIPTPVAEALSSTESRPAHVFVCISFLSLSSLSPHFGTHVSGVGVGDETRLVGQDGQQCHQGLEEPMGSHEDGPH